MNYLYVSTAAEAPINATDSSSKSASNDTETLETSAKTTSPTRRRLRWPLSRRRKLSTARRFLLRTRKPLPTRRTPRPLHPTKSSRPSRWRPKARLPLPPPRYTTRLSIFKKFQTLPTRPPTTTSTTTEYVYTRKPDSDDDVLTSDFIKSSGVIKLEDGIEWNNSLADKNSREFKTLALDMKVLVRSSCPEPSGKGDLHYQGVLIVRQVWFVIEDRFFSGYISKESEFLELLENGIFKIFLGLDFLD